MWSNLGVDLIESNQRGGRLSLCANQPHEIMRNHPVPKWLAAFTAIIICNLSLPQTALAQVDDPQSEGIEVLTRGPVHEAFAETISFDPQVGMIVDKEPPQPIEEIPPEQEMEGENVTWIPGYWGWDDEQNDFLWISGIWRNLPPDREWVPGYWAGIDNGKYQWTSGYWQDAEIEQVAYLPAPPKSLERGPSAKAVTSDQTWIPGSWVYREDNYAWRPGNWITARNNWMWVPAYYRWTPRGYVYVDGYWDYPVARRGVVFAPVRIQRAYYSRPNYVYTPATIISLTVFTNHLFVRPHYDHYYFGDYYEPRYRDRGYYASYSYSSSRRGYDPFYSHQRWENRKDRNWDRERREYFEYRRDNESARPPKSWSALASHRQDDRKTGDYQVVERFDRVVNNGGADRQKFRKVDQKDRERFVSQRQEIRKYSKEREEAEVRGRAIPNGSKVLSVEKTRRSPVVAEKRDTSKKLARRQSVSSRARGIVPPVGKTSAARSMRNLATNPKPIQIGRPPTRRSSLPSLARNPENAASLTRRKSNPPTLKWPPRNPAYAVSLIKRKAHPPNLKSRLRNPARNPADAANLTKRKAHPPNRRSSPRNPASVANSPRTPNQPNPKSRLLSRSGNPERM